MREGPMKTRIILLGLMLLPLFCAAAIPARAQAAKPAAPSPGLPKPLTSITHDLTKPRPAAPPLPFAAKRPASPAPQAAAPVVVAEPVVTTVGALCETWPEAVRQEIDKTDTRNASVSIPLSRLEAAMKAGRVVFAWSELRGWLNPPPAKHHFACIPSTVHYFNAAMKYISIFLQNITNP